MKDKLQQFRTLKAKLLAERHGIEERLAEISAVLDTGSQSTRASSRSLDKITADYLEKDLSDTEKGGSYTPRRGSLPAKILRALGRTGEPMQVKDITAAVKKRGNLVNQACLLLLGKGRLRREGRGRYCLE